MNPDLILSPEGEQFALGLFFIGLGLIYILIRYALTGQNVWKLIGFVVLFRLLTGRKGE